MFLLMVRPKGKDSGVWFVWERSDLSAVLIEAEQAFKKGDCEVVKVVEGGTVCKAKWGPEDPGPN